MDSQARLFLEDSLSLPTGPWPAYSVPSKSDTCTLRDCGDHNQTAVHTAMVSTCQVLWEAGVKTARKDGFQGHREEPAIGYGGTVCLAAH